MRWLKRWFAIYVFGNIHVAMAAYSLTKITMMHCDYNNQPLANFIFFATVLSYNFIRLFQIDRINSMVTLWFRANKGPLLLINGAALAGFLYNLLKFEWKDLIPLVPLSLATLLYVFPFKKRIMGLRFVPGLKLFLIALTWAGVTYFLPVYMQGNWETRYTLVHFIQRLLFVLAITIPFDIRDAQFDQQELATLPQVIGIQASKWMAITALLIFIILDTQFQKLGQDVFWTDLSIGVGAAIMIAFSGTNRPRYFTAFWVEAIPIIWYLLLLIIVD